MELREYLTENNITMSEFGRRVKRAQSIISRLAAKRHWPDRTTALRIVRATEGKCSLEDLYSLPPALRAMIAKHRNDN